MYHHVLQQMLKQVDAAFGRFFRGLGKYPKTKRQSLENRIKLRPRSLLEDRENHPRWWVSLGTLR